MTRIELDNLIKQWENAKVDFKRELWNIKLLDNIEDKNKKKELQDIINFKKNELIKDIFSLTNGDIYSIDKTAYLIIGVDDKTKEICKFDITNLGKNYSIERFKKELLQWLNNYAQPEFLALDMQIVEDEILVISIPPRGSLISLSKDLKLKNKKGIYVDKKGTTYYRIGEDIRVASSEVIGEFEKAFSKNKNINTLINKRYYYLLALILLIGTISLWFNSKKPKSISKTQTLHTLEKYVEQDSGVKIIFSKDKKSWEKIIAYGQSKITANRDIQKALTIASLRAKANISKFLEVDIKTDDTIKEISQNEKVSETLISTISESSKAILRGIEISKYQIDTNNILFVKAIATRKNIEAVSSIK